MKKVLLLAGAIAVCFVATANASSPIRILSGGKYRFFPLDPKTANWLIRVVVEHHKENSRLEISCEGDVFTASERQVSGIEKDGIFEELFFFYFPAGTYVCEAILVRGEKTFPVRTPEFFVTSTVKGERND